jgi:hypothetical protein
MTPNNFQRELKRRIQQLSAAKHAARRAEAPAVAAVFQVTQFVQAQMLTTQTAKWSELGNPGKGGGRKSLGGAEKAICY